jgi:outer membrane lipoprotein SlyB
MMEERTMKNLVLLLCISFATAAGCVSQPSGSSYSQSEAGRVETVQHGAIVSLRPVRIQGSRSGAGEAAGAVAGGVAASGANTGRTGLVESVIGIVGGAMLGSLTEEGLTRADGVEIGIKMDDGREISVVQALDPNEQFRVGDKVRVLYSGSRARVAH